MKSCSAVTAKGRQQGQKAQTKFFGLLSGCFGFFENLIMNFSKFFRFFSGILWIYIGILILSKISFGGHNDCFDFWGVFVLLKCAFSSCFSPRSQHKTKKCCKIKVHDHMSCSTSKSKNHVE